MQTEYKNAFCVILCDSTVRQSQTQIGRLANSIAVNKQASDMCVYQYKQYTIYSIDTFDDMQIQFKAFVLNK